MEGELLGRGLISNPRSVEQKLNDDFKMFPRAQRTNTYL